MKLTIWCNGRFADAVAKRLVDGVRPHRIQYAPKLNANVLAAGEHDPGLAACDVAFGQPVPDDCLTAPRLRWISVTTAGYTRYDTPEFREALQAKGAVLTNASGVFSEPCAQQVLAYLMAEGRQLLQSHNDQVTDHSWHHIDRRYASRLLTGQTILLFGYGAIARRLVELLAPLRVTVYAVRRQRRSEPGVRIVPEEDLTRVLPLADHVVNLLSENESTRNYVNARRLEWFKPGARFYNVGRGTTVDQRALLRALETGRLGAAYLDVTDPEPLPPDNPLWTAPNCFITPHTAGGRSDQDEAIVAHFLENLEAFANGKELRDQVI